MIPIARGAAQPGQKPIKETDAGDSSKPECWEPRSLGLYTEQNHIVVQQGVYDSVVRGGIYNTLKHEHLLHLIDRYDRVPRGSLIMKNRWLYNIHEHECVPHGPLNNIVVQEYVPRGPLNIHNTLRHIQTAPEDPRRIHGGSFIVLIS